jgi:RNA polymerase sigma-70 factor (ECF subfamily)
MTDRQALAARFESQRGRLRAVAHQLLGSASDAEDAVQEAWLRLERSDAAAIDNLDAWLTTVVSRISLDTLRARTRRRETQWVPEPWPAEDVAAPGDPEEALASADAVGVALLVVLETLSPPERLAFVLHDVFGVPFAEIALVLDRTPDAARQLASRARRRVRSAPAPEASDRRRSRAVVDAWLRATSSGDFTALLSLLDENVVLRADYGANGIRVLTGADSVAQQARGAARLAANSIPVLIDGRPGVLAAIDGVVLSLMKFEIADGRITGFDVLADPVRLGRLGPAALPGAGD